MKEYLKMADVFLATENNFCALKSADHLMIARFVTNKECEYAAHAINSHDELVENMRHYKQEAEQWEARATKEASRAQDLEAEVEWLREELKSAANQLMEEG